MLTKTMWLKLMQFSQSLEDLYQLSFVCKATSELFTNNIIWKYKMDDWNWVESRIYHEECQGKPENDPDDINEMKYFEICRARVERWKTFNIQFQKLKQYPETVWYGVTVCKYKIWKDVKNNCCFSKDLVVPHYVPKYFYKWMQTTYPPGYQVVYDENDKKSYIELYCDIGCEKFDVVLRDVREGYINNGVWGFDYYNTVIFLCAEKKVEYYGERFKSKPGTYYKLNISESEWRYGDRVWPIPEEKLTDFEQLQRRYLKKI